MVYYKTIENGESIKLFNLSDFPAGIYFLQIVLENKQTSQTIQIIR